MITLPEDPRKSTINAFWITLVLLSGALLAFYQMRLAFLLVVIMIFCGYIYPKFPRRTYFIWNKLALLTAKICKYAIVAICYFLIFSALRIFGSNKFCLKLGDFCKSEWKSRERMLESENTESRQHVINKINLAKIYILWAIHNKSHWAIALLPFLMMLSLISEESKEIIPSNIYTLY